MTHLALLYIDDAPADIELMRALLAHHGVLVEGALKGREGIASYEPVRHAAVAIDWNLPDMDGPEVAEALLEKDRGCRIVFISGLFEDEHFVTAANLGIHRCFRKNVDMSHVERIRAFVTENDPSNLRHAV